MAVSTWRTLSRRLIRARYEVVRPTLIDTGGDLFAMTSPNSLNWFHHE